MNAATQRTLTMNTISLRILSLVAAGMDLRAAFDAVLGAGAFDKMAADLHSALTAK